MVLRGIPPAGPRGTLRPQRPLRACTAAGTTFCLPRGSPPLYRRPVTPSERSRTLLRMRTFPPGILHRFIRKTCPFQSSLGSSRGPAIQSLTVFRGGCRRRGTHAARPRHREATPRRPRAGLSRAAILFAGAGICQAFIETASRALRDLVPQGGLPQGPRAGHLPPTQEVPGVTGLHPPCLRIPSGPATSRLATALTQPAASRLCGRLVHTGPHTVPPSHPAQLRRLAERDPLVPAGSLVNRPGISGVLRAHERNAPSCPRQDSDVPPARPRVCRIQGLPR